jgi:hypothetical protein
MGQRSRINARYEKGPADIRGMLES